MKLFLIVSEGGSVSQAKEVDHIIEDEGQTADEGELVGLVLEDECDYVGETYVGGHEEEEESAQDYCLHEGVFLEAHDGGGVGTGWLLNYKFFH